jgi:hypothetical protein
MEEKYGFVYIWYDKYRKMYYVGCHWGREDDGYICSSDRMRDAYRRRPHDFKRRIIARIYTSKQDMFLEEQRWFTMIKPEELKVRYYNLNIIWKHWLLNSDKTVSIREKISIKTKEAMQRPEVRERYLEGLKTRDIKTDPETIEKRRKGMIGKNVGKKRTPEQIEHLRKIQTGKKIHSEEHKKHLSETSSFKMAKCIHCGEEGNIATIARYHNDNCKIGLKDLIISTINMPATKAAKIVGVNRDTVKKYRELWVS